MTSHKLRNHLKSASVPGFSLSNVAQLFVNILSSSVKTKKKKKKREAYVVVVLQTENPVFSVLAAQIQKSKIAAVCQSLNFSIQVFLNDLKSNTLYTL